MARDSRRLVDELVGLTGERVRIGTGTALDLNATRSELAESDVDLFLAQTSVLETRAALAESMGLRFLADDAAGRSMLLPRLDSDASGGADRRVGSRCETRCPGGESRHRGRSSELAQGMRPILARRRGGCGHRDRGCARDRAGNEPGDSDLRSEPGSDSEGEVHARPGTSALRGDSPQRRASGSNAPSGVWSGRRMPTACFRGA